MSSSSQARVTPSEPGRQSKNVEEKKSNTDLHDSIKKVTNAIDDYCKTSTGSPHKKSRRKLSSKGTFQGKFITCFVGMPILVWQTSCELREEALRRSNKYWGVVGP